MVLYENVIFFSAFFLAMMCEFPDMDGNNIMVCASVDTGSVDFLARLQRCWSD